MMTIVLATWGISVVGTMFSAMTVNLRLARIDAADAGLSDSDSLSARRHPAHGGTVAGKPLGPNVYLWVRLLVGFDIIYTALALALVDTVLVG